MVSRLTTLALITGLLATANAQLRPGEPPAGITLYPAAADQAVRVVEHTEPAEWFTQGPLPDFTLSQPKIMEGGKVAIVSGPAGAYNVWIFPASGQPKVKGFTLTLGPTKPTPPPTPPAPAPSITFTLTPLEIALGEKTTAIWETKNATEATLDGKTVPTAGRLDLTPTAAGSFKATLTAKGKGGTKTASVTATVRPKPAPPPAPIAAEGFHVLFLEDTAARPDLPAEQIRILTDPTVRDFLDARAAGRFRIIDPANNLTQDLPAYRDALKRPRGGKFWLIASNTANAAAPGFEGPWPATAAETLTILQRVAGPGGEVPSLAAPPLDLSKLPVITEANFKDLVGDSKTVKVNGKIRFLGTKPRPPEAARVLAPLRLTTIPRSQWKARIAAQQGATLSDLARRYKVPVLDQDGLPYCHAFSPAAALMALQAFQCGRWEEISAGSIGGPATGFVAEGAWIGDDLNVLTSLGAATTKFVPMMAVKKSEWGDFAAGQANAALHKTSIWRELDNRSFDQTVTLLLTGKLVCVGLNWWSHAVTYFDAVIAPSGNVGILFRNSWGADYGTDGWAILEESKATPDEAYTPEQIYSLAL